MTWTYNSTLIASSGLAWVRWRVGDTDTTDQLQEDAEINAALSDYGDKRYAASAVAKAIAAKFARRMDSKMGKLDLKNSQLYDHYIALASELDIEVASAGATPWAASVSRSEKESQQQDTNRTKPAFARGMFAVEDTVHGETAISSSSTS